MCASRRSSCLELVSIFNGDFSVYGNAVVLEAPINSCRLDKLVADKCIWMTVPAVWLLRFQYSSCDLNTQHRWNWVILWIVLHRCLLFQPSIVPFISQVIKYTTGGFLVALNIPTDNGRTFFLLLLFFIKLRIAVLGWIRFQFPWMLNTKHVKHKNRPRNGESIDYFILARI